MRKLELREIAEEALRLASNAKKDERLAGWANRAAQYGMKAVHVSTGDADLGMAMLYRIQIDQETMAIRYNECFSEWPFDQKDLLLDMQTFSERFLKPAIAGIEGAQPKDDA